MSEKTKKEDKYVEAVGRRKTSVARVRITPAGKNSFEVNGRDLASYFITKEMMMVVESSIKEAGDDKYKVTALLKGGGVHSQAEAMRLGIARAIVESNQSLRTKLKQAGFLKRDPRAKERRKFGLKKARKAPQWSKRQRELWWKGVGKTIVFPWRKAGEAVGKPRGFQRTK